jgi:hypothetical protein
LWVIDVLVSGSRSRDGEDMRNLAFAESMNNRLHAKRLRRAAMLDRTARELRLHNDQREESRGLGTITSGSRMHVPRITNRHRHLSLPYREHHCLNDDAGSILSRQHFGMDWLRIAFPFPARISYGLTKICRIVASCASLQLVPDKGRFHALPKTR